MKARVSGQKAIASIGLLMAFLHQAQAAYTFYTIVGGDSKASIARSHGVVVDALTLANPQFLDASYSLVGGVVQIPAACPSKAARVHLMVPGDTIENLARDNGIAVTALKAANPQITDPSILNPGDCIVLSSSSSGGSSSPSPSAAPPPTQPTSPPSGGSCSFSISSSGGISCPAGQLDDGQIRLNGSYPTAIFTISEGKITDSKGSGCIITGAPTTQVQCDAGTPPVAGFSIDSANRLLWKGNPQFFACPATDTEYNIYIHPDFGQAKCFGVFLAASGCGSAPPPPPPPPPPKPTTSLSSICPAPSTITETCTETAVSTVTAVMTVTSKAQCVATTSTSALSFTTSGKPVGTGGGCRRCTAAYHGNGTGSITYSWHAPSGTASLNY